ncbi:MAG: hypothetical protein KJN64_10440 [Ignavibacteria bacterium]|nr:hypothetical protein [Ignavibacteria bacterium]MBT8382328.1 hypothetical protein [Ignavibacteria bacterium]MBT8390571.1 hypothetical protein [Ignavibacteria bacterium]NNJ51941.1 hypothetical protein [Ignavibacteriaceae bacterium]NNL20431.1 hypothetical protein [Ignavibacteriaceae bacterium]
MKIKKNIATSIFMLLIVILFVSSVLTSCKCLSCSQEEAKVPIEVLEKADSFIVSSTGKDFFDKYITADFFKTKHTPPYYELAYKLFMPDKPYVSATIKFTVDSVGNVMKNRDIVGIPRCRYFPEECNFKIDEQTARLIASEKGLKEGIKEWDAGFLWDFKRERYVWNILSTLNEFGGEDNYKATGQEMIIDPTSGEVLALNDWRVN